MKERCIHRITCIQMVGKERRKIFPLLWFHFNSDLRVHTYDMPDYVCRQPTSLFLYFALVETRLCEYMVSSLILFWLNFQTYLLCVYVYTYTVYFALWPLVDGFLYQVPIRYNWRRLSRWVYSICSDEKNPLIIKILPRYLATSPTIINYMERQVPHNNSTFHSHTQNKKKFLLCEENSNSRARFLRYSWLRARASRTVWTNQSDG